MSLVGCGGDPCEPAIKSLWAGVLPAGEVCPPMERQTTHDAPPPVPDMGETRPSTSHN